jgi:hypothetical protein
MNQRTTYHRARTWISDLLERADRFAFGELDLDATARGWEVRRDRRFHRTYRDPRWNTIEECPGCDGEGLDGARSCQQCDGMGTVRREPAPLAGTP